MARISRDFSGDAALAVEDLLATYDDRERERVHLAILDLSRGELERVRHNVGRALTDFRDVLLWAELDGFGDYLS
jgi:hypothetical protein